MITAAELHQLAPYAHDKVERFVDPLNAAMLKFFIDNPLREAAFLAQILHESGEFRYVRELASGEEYEGRAGLGNTEPGDGRKYKGRGLIQITGRFNYMLCGDALGLDLVEHPELLESPDNACLSAAWFWETHGLNALADHENFTIITRRINGGLNGLESRKAYYDKALALLGG